MELEQTCNYRLCEHLFHGLDFCGGGLYTATVSAGLSTLNSVTLDGGFVVMGKYPKGNTGYLTVSSDQLHPFQVQDYQVFPILRVEKLFGDPTIGCCGEELLLRNLRVRYHFHHSLQLWEDQCTRPKLILGSSFKITPALALHRGNGLTIQVLIKSQCILEVARQVTMSTSLQLKT